MGLMHFWRGHRVTVTRPSMLTGMPVYRYAVHWPTTSHPALLHWLGYGCSSCQRMKELEIRKSKFKSNSSLQFLSSGIL